MTDQNALFAKTEAAVAAARAGMGECRTAAMIDKNEAWEVIAAAARQDGLDELAAKLESAAEEWEF